MPPIQRLLRKDANTIPRHSGANFCAKLKSGKTLLSSANLAAEKFSLPRSVKEAARFLLGLNLHSCPNTGGAAACASPQQHWWTLGACLIRDHDIIKPRPNALSPEWRRRLMGADVFTPGRSWRADAEIWKVRLAAAARNLLWHLRRQETKRALTHTPSHH